MHMSTSSVMMMGSKLQLKFLTEHHVGLHARYRWTGAIMGLQMDFTVQVTRYIDGREKVWETIGDSKLIIYSWYRMSLEVQPAVEGTRAKLSITYEKPKGLFGRIVSFFVADWYCKWCLRKMLEDAGKKL